MSMLADPRRKQKWTLNPRGKQWSEDSNKFGQKMLEKMGWTSGKGLGAKEQGMTEHVRVTFKDDQSGIGYCKNDHDNEWTQLQEGFSDLLMNLQKNQNLEQTELMETKEIALSGTSLEQKSKQSRARVHYQKFTRGKDVNKYSPKDLANIFGKKTLEEKSKQEEKVEEEFIAEPVGSKDNIGGVLTIKGGNMSEYFENKKSSIMKKKLGAKESKQESSESEDEGYAGFGFNGTKSNQCDSYSQSVQNFTNYAFENPCLDLNASPKVKPSRKRKRLAFSNEGLDLNYPDKSDTPKKIKTQLEISETSDCFVNPALNLEVSVNETCNGAEFEVPRPQSGFVNPALDLSEEIIKKKPKNKRKKEVELSDTGFENSALNMNCSIVESHSGTEFEVSRIQMGLDNDALDLSDEASGKKRVTFNDLVEFNTDVIKKKKRKKKLDKFEVENDKLKQKKKRAASEEVAMVFVNEALDVESISEEVEDNKLNERKCRKAKRKKNKRMSNLETIEEVLEEREISDDVIRDLEVITVQDSIEKPEEICEETPKKSKKKKKKKEEKIQEDLDVIEIKTVVHEQFLIKDNVQVSEETNILKKKKKKKEKRDEVEEKATINGFDKENKEESITVEKRKKKKKRKSIETCEFFLDVIEEEVEELEIEEKVEEPPESKKVQEKHSKDSEVNSEPEEDSESLKDKNFKGYSTPLKKRCLGNEIPSEVLRSPYEMMAKKSKRVLKAMFAKSPVVHFKGSNINEIKGYGVD